MFNLVEKQPTCDINIIRHKQIDVHYLVMVVPWVPIIPVTLTTCCTTLSC